MLECKVLAWCGERLALVWLSEGVRLYSTSAPFLHGCDTHWQVRIYVLEITICQS